MLGSSGEESTSELASKTTSSPQLTSSIKESDIIKRSMSIHVYHWMSKISYLRLHLSRHGTETSRDTEQNTISFLKVVNSDDRNIRLSRSVHLLKDLFRKSFGN